MFERIREMIHGLNYTTYIHMNKHITFIVIYIQNQDSGANGKENEVGGQLAFVISFDSTITYCTFSIQYYFWVGHLRVCF
jgi:hypothetical protein